jgi:hypothetical protein
MITKLPRYIYFIINDYLKLSERFKLSECSKFLMQQFKQYPNPEIIKKKVINEEEFKMIQKHPNIKFYHEKTILNDDEDLSYLNNFHTLKVIYCENEHLKYLNNAKILFIEGYEFPLDFSDLRSVKQLTVSTNVPGLYNMDGLKSVEYLDLSGTDVTDEELKNLQSLKNLHTLIIRECKKIIKPPLLSIHIINATKCINLKDVSGFKNVQDLNISYCNISDISALKNVYKLNLMKCLNIRHLPKLSAKYLNISYTNITDISNTFDCKYLSNYGNSNSGKSLSISS